MTQRPTSPSPERPRAMRARQIALALVASVLAGMLLASYGWSQGALRIPVPLSDPLGLAEGVPVRLGSVSDAERLGTSSVDAVTWTAVGTFPQGSETIHIPPMGPADFPFRIAPSRLDVEARLGEEMVVQVPPAQRADDLPARIVITAATIVAIDVSDDSDVPPVTLGPFGAERGTGTAWRREDRCEAQRCRYRPAGEARRLTMVISAQGERLTSVLDVLGNDTTPNRLTGRLALALDTDLPDGASIEVTLLAPSGTAFF